MHRCLSPCLWARVVSRWFISGVLERGSIFVCICHLHTSTVIAHGATFKSPSATREILGSETVCCPTWDSGVESGKRLLPTSFYWDAGLTWSCPGKIWKHDCQSTRAHAREMCFPFSLFKSSACFSIISFTVLLICRNRQHSLDIKKGECQVYQNAYTLLLSKLAHPLCKEIQHYLVKIKRILRDPACALLIWRNSHTYTRRRV